MKFVALVSGGKDSIYAAWEAIRNGHEIVCCAHLAPPSSSSSPRTSSDRDGDDDVSEEEEEEEESYMYQTAASEAVATLVTECWRLPLVVRRRTGRSLNTNLAYDDGGVDDGGVDDVGKKPSGVVEGHDEVEDLLELLRAVRSDHPTVEAVSSGAILSTYQRTRIESVCCRIGLASLSYLWRVGPQRPLLERMIEDGMDAVLVKTACPPGLVPRRHLNRTVRDLHGSGLFDQLKEKFDFHVCGEGGEYETLVLDCPLFERRLVLDETAVEVEGDDDDDGVGVLKILKCHAEDKEGGVMADGCAKGGLSLPDRIRSDEEGKGGGGGAGAARSSETPPSEPAAAADAKRGAARRSDGAALRPPPSSSPTPPPRQLPRVKVLPGGLAHVSEVMSPAPARATSSSSSSSSSCAAAEAEAEAEAALTEARSILSTLRVVLSSSPSLPFPCGPRDVVFVHLYLSDMSHFRLINGPYRDFFGTNMPPSRSCVSVGKGSLPGGRRVSLDCVVQAGSGSYLRLRRGGDRPDNNAAEGREAEEAEATFAKRASINPTVDLRSVLHVQSISHWAPVCIGPYCQSNSLRSCLSFLAGQIGLSPHDMKLVDDDDGDDGGRKGWERQLGQCWTNVASVLDGTDGGRLRDGLGGVVYLSSDPFETNDDDDGVGDEEDVWAAAEAVNSRELGRNGGITAGYVDGTSGLGGKGEVDDGDRGEADDEPYGGYEDEETWREMTGGAAAEEDDEAERDATDDVDDDVVSVLMVSVPRLPMDASAEVEWISSTRRAADALGLSSTSVAPSDDEEEGEEDEGDDDLVVPSVANGGLRWDTGHDAPVPRSRSSSSRCAAAVDGEGGETSVRVEAFARAVGNGCAALATAAASWTALRPLAPAPPSSSSSSRPPSSPHPPPPPPWIDAESVLEDVIDASLRCLTNDRIGMEPLHVLHVRLYHLSGEGGGEGGDDDDGVALRSALRAVLASRWSSWSSSLPFDAGGGRRRRRGGRTGPRGGGPPACTVVPVGAMKMAKLSTASPSSSCSSSSSSSEASRRRRKVRDGRRDEGNEKGGGGTTMSRRASSSSPPSTDATFLAMQMIAADPIHMETELWIRHGR